MLTLLAVTTGAIALAVVIDGVREERRRARLHWLRCLD